MKFKSKLRLFLFPAILIPAAMVIAVNFFSTSRQIRALELELLQDTVQYFIAKCDAGHNLVKAAGMEQVEFYQEATQKGILQEAQSIRATSGMLTIIDTRSRAILLSTGPAASRIILTSREIQQMMQQQQGVSQYTLASPSGRRIDVLVAFGVYAPWNWLVISHVEHNFIYHYLYAALTVSALMIALVLLLAGGVIYRWSQRISASLEQLEQGTKRLAEHDFEVTLEITGQDEFGRLANSFNVMAAAIRQAQRELRTAAQRAEEANHALRESEERLRLTTDNLPDSYVYQYTYNAAGQPQFLFVSNGVERVHPGVKVADVLRDAAALHNQLEPDQLPGLLAAEAASARALSDFTMDLRFRLPNGERRWLQAHSQTRQDTSGQVFWDGAALDITDRKREEEELQLYRAHLEELVAARTAELEAANKELQSFAYVVSHDLKAPLRAIARLAQWLVEDYAGAFDDRGKEMTALLVGRVKRMDALIDGILEYSRIGRIVGQNEVIDLNHLLLEVLDLLAPLPNIRIFIAPDLPCLIGDKTRIIQIFQNLIGNAIKFMNQPQGEIAVNWTEDGVFWRFSVTDNGPGIDPKYHDKIFQIFQTLHPRDEVENTGVGLAIVKKIVEFYGGAIWVESEAGQGSAFIFTLPKM